MSTRGLAISTSTRGVVNWPSHFGAMGRTYAEHAFTGSALAMQGAHEIEIVLHALGEGHGREVLDIGAGTGRFTAPLAAAGWKVTALDGSEEMLACIAESVPSADRVWGLLGERLPFEAERFAAVVAMRVVKYVPDTVRALTEMVRVAQSDAPVVFDVANRNSLARFGYTDSSMGFVTPGSLPRIVDDAGLRVSKLHDGFRLPNPVVARATTDAAARAVAIAEGGLARVFGKGTGRVARSIIVESTRLS